MALPPPQEKAFVSLLWYSPCALIAPLCHRPPHNIVPFKHAWIQKDVGDHILARLSGGTVKRFVITLGGLVLPAMINTDSGLASGDTFCLPVCIDYKKDRRSGIITDVYSAAQGMIRWNNPIRKTVVFTDSSQECTG